MSSLKTVVVTSINEPTEALVKFASLKGINLVVVGDKKTPGGWHLDSTDFLDCSKQLNLGFKLASIMPWSHYCRKNLGYLYAILQGSEIIIDTDDDNIPKDDFEIPDFEHSGKTLKSNLGFINIYKMFTDAHIWPRGLPLDSISALVNQELETQTYLTDKNVGIWQGLADEDPDVDAIYRLISDQPVYFKGQNIVLEPGSIAPFNSQNTIFRKELFSLMYLPASVSFRFTDILRGIVAQPIMWAAGFCLGFTGPTVIQKRNPHDYFDDFKQEVPMYLHVQDAYDITLATTSSRETLNDNLYNVYEELQRCGIVSMGEINMLEAWLEDLSRIN